MRIALALALVLSLSCATTEPVERAPNDVMVQGIQRISLGTGFTLLGASTTTIAFFANEETFKDSTRTVLYGVGAGMALLGVLGLYFGSEDVRAAMIATANNDAAAAMKAQGDTRPSLNPFLETGSVTNKRKPYVPPAPAVPDAGPELEEAAPTDAGPQ